MFRRDVGEGIENAAADPDRDRAESQLIEPLFASREGIFPDQQTAIVTQHTVRPTDLVDHLGLRHRHGQPVQLGFRLHHCIQHAASGAGADEKGQPYPTANPSNHLGATPGNANRTRRQRTILLIQRGVEGHIRIMAIVVTQSAHNVRPDTRGILVEHDIGICRKGNPGTGLHFGL